VAPQPEAVPAAEEEEEAVAAEVQPGEAPERLGVAPQPVAGAAERLKVPEQAAVEAAAVEAVVVLVVAQEAECRRP
jgi:hypothetical protein